MTDWIRLKDRVPEEDGTPYLIGRSFDAGVPSVMMGIYLDGRFLAYSPAGFQEFKSPTHWAIMPDVPLDEVETE